MARRRFNPTRSGSRPNRGWSNTTFAVAVTIPAASKVLLGSFTLVTTGIDITILRSVGGVSVASDQTAAIESQIGAVGAIMVTDTALAAGIASIPGPVTQGDDDGWFLHQSFAQQSQNVNTMTVSNWYAMNSKGKRIWPGTGMAMALVGENIHATNGLTVLLVLRILSQVRGTR